MNGWDIEEFLKESFNSGDTIAWQGCAAVLEEKRDEKIRHDPALGDDAGISDSQV
jgi:hypothetical protein